MQLIPLGMDSNGQEHIAQTGDTMKNTTSSSTNAMQKGNGSGGLTDATQGTDFAKTKADVGLGSVDNTSDASKPISTATQTALNLKANTSSISTVGTTGAYADLSGKPTIPAAQIQTNYTQSNSAALDYLLNKPSLWRVGTKKSTHIEYISSGVVASGSVTFYLTDDGTSTGNAVFTTLFKESANFWVDDATGQYQFGGYTFAVNKKSLTITAGKLGSVLLGIIQFIAPANGVTVYLTIKGE